MKTNVDKQINITCEGSDKININELIEFQGGLKKIKKENLEKLKSRIKRHGFNAPIFVWENKSKKYILDGHQRLTAIKELVEEGYKIQNLPVVYIKAKNGKDAKDKLLGITSQYGEFEHKILDMWIDEIEIKDDIRLVDQEIIIAKNKSEETLNDDTIPTDVLEITKKGDVWKLNNHLLICTDSSSPDNLVNIDNTNCMVFTDPPYEIDLSEFEDTMEIINDIIILCTFKQAIYLAQRYKFHFDFVMINKTPKSCMNKRRPYYLHQTGLYVTLDGKTSFHCNNAKNIRSKNGYWGTVIDAPRNVGYGYGKNVEAIVCILSGWDKKHVVDYFAGTGSTLIACDKMDKTSINYEIDKNKCDKIVIRYVEWCKSNKKKVTIMKNHDKIDVNSLYR